MQNNATVTVLLLCTVSVQILSTLHSFCTLCILYAISPNFAVLCTVTIKNLELYQKQQFEVKLVIMMDLFNTHKQIFTSPDVN